MDYFISNVGIATLAFTSWYIAGLGFAIILLPRRYQREAFLLAPLVGMCLLTLLGLFEITVLLTPFIPRINVGCLLLISLVFCLWNWHNVVLTAWQHFRRCVIWLGLLPLLMLLVFAWLFHNGGFQQLAGGSDQLQYSQNARQISEEMNTCSPRDIPVPRQDHFVYDMTTTTLPYMKLYRRGAEVMLATDTAITKLSYEEAFPVTILCALLTLGFALGFLGRVFLRFSLQECLLLQMVFLSSFYFLLLHIQGSLALLMSVAPNLVALALLSRVILVSSWRWILLTGIVVAADLSLYSEPALFNIVLPTVLLIIWQWQRMRVQGSHALRRVLIVYFIILVCAPFALYSLIANIFYNFYAALYTVTHHSLPTISMVLQQWNLAAVLLGNMSYYDMSAFNNQVAQFVVRQPWIGLLEFFILSGLGLLGFCKIKNRFVYLSAIILLVWFCASLVLAYQLDALRFIRSLQYAMPFALIGLVMLACHYPILYVGRWSIFWHIATWIGRIALISFVLINVYTIVHTSRYITSHDVSNDNILLRFDERGPPWQQLQNELQISAEHNAPVLISGYKETIRPLALSIIMRSQPHVLGTSILSFWPIYNVAVLPRSHFNTRLTEAALQTAQRQQNQPWAKLEPSLIKRSEQAVVPVGNGYPAEWQASKDVYAPKIKRFTNICDVIYRNEYAVTLASEMTSSLKQDANGTYRLLWASGPVIIHDNDNSPQQLIIEYEGKVGDVQLCIKDECDAERAIKHGRLIKIVVNVSSGDIQQLNLIVDRTVKLRSMAWIEE